MALFAVHAERAYSAPPQAATPSQPPAADSSSTYQDSTNELTVTVGKSVLVDCAQPIQRVAIGLGDIAEASAINPTEIMVDGKTAGETSLIIWDIHGGRQFFNVTVRAPATVTGDSLDAVRRELRSELPGQSVRVSYSNNAIFLRGTVNDLVSSTRAMQIASAAGKVVNLLDVNVPKADTQILLKVRFASVDRSRARQLGINLFNLGYGNAIGGVTTSQFAPPTISGGSGSSGSSSGGVSGNGVTATFSNEFNLLAFFPGLGAGADISALETKGIVQVLAEPNVMATNGKEASFLAGGEYPYPVAQGSSGGLTTVTIEFKEYGIRLNFIPTITPRGTIRLQVAPEVSALDYSNQIDISGFNVPAITSRKVNTEVELADGESFMIGGLLDKSTNSTFEKIPFIGDIPIIGKLFQSELKTKNDTELIVIVTPVIVSPLAAGTELPSLHYTEPFIPPNSNIPMHQPDEKTAANTPAPAPASIPVEALIDSMKPEKPLIVENTGTFGAGGGSGINSGPSSTGAGYQPPQP